MSALVGLIARVEAAEAGLGGFIVRDALVPYADAVAALQRDQLMAGKARGGGDMRPYYDEDLRSSGGYFSTDEAAKRYIAYKGRITPDGRRNKRAPNLYISGAFHRELTVELRGDCVAFSPSGALSRAVMARYAGQFGLTDGNWMIIWGGGALRSLVKRLREVLYGLR